MSTDKRISTEVVEELSKMADDMHDEFSRVRGVYTRVCSKLEVYSERLNVIVDGINSEDNFSIGEIVKTTEMVISNRINSVEDRKFKEYNEWLPNIQLGVDRVRERVRAYANRGEWSTYVLESDFNIPRGYNKRINNAVLYTLNNLGFSVTTCDSYETGKLYDVSWYRGGK